jgi:hypothetical protein
MNRRRFAFWIGFGLFSLSDKLRVSGLDALAAAAMRRTEVGKPAAASVKRSGGEHWAVGGDKKWWWFERENLVNGDWWLTGITTPIHRETGERREENIGYIDDNLVPEGVRNGDAATVLLASYQEAESHHDHEHAEVAVDLDPQLPTAKRRGGHGRPPSKWLRSLNADEIRIWLKTIKTPDAGVSGMTVWMHLTRDHSFDEIKIEGLNEKEQDKLHAAAHFGY